MQHKTSDKKLAYACKYRSENKDKINAYARQRYENQKALGLTKRDEYFAMYRKSKSNEISEKAKKFRKEHPDLVKQWQKRYQIKSPIYRISSRLRTRLKNAIRYKLKTGSAIRDLGCSIYFFKSYLEKMFTPGMSWENYGKWHIDHIRPLASFDLTDRLQLLQACNYTNLQPLWALDNMKKGAHNPIPRARADSASTIAV